MTNGSLVAKCIKHIKTGDIIRIDADNAAYLVDKGTHVYTTRNAWKKSRQKLLKHLLRRNTRR